MTYNLEKFFRLHWKWRVEHPDMNGYECLIFRVLKIQVPNHCFACLACGTDCTLCPVVWPRSDDPVIHCTTSVYGDFIKADTDEGRRLLAAIISNLEWNGESYFTI